MPIRDRAEYMRAYRAKQKTQATRVVRNHEACDLEIARLKHELHQRDVLLEQYRRKEMVQW